MAFTMVDAAMGRPRFVQAHAVGGRGGPFRRVERGHYALPNGRWVQAPNGFVQVHPNANAGFVQIQPHAHPVPHHIAEPNQPTQRHPFTVDPSALMSGPAGGVSIEEQIAALLAAYAAEHPHLGPPTGGGRPGFVY